MSMAENPNSREESPRLNNCSNFKEYANFLASHTHFSYFDWEEPSLSYCHLSNQDFHKIYGKYKAELDRRFRKLARRSEPSSVYDPIRYAIGSGGKRVRALLVLLSSEAVGGSRKQAIDAA